MADFIEPKAFRDPEADIEVVYFNGGDRSAKEIVEWLQQHLTRSAFRVVQVLSATQADTRIIIEQQRSPDGILWQQIATEGDWLYFHKSSHFWDVPGIWRRDNPVPFQERFLPIE